MRASLGLPPVGLAPVLTSACSPERQVGLADLRKPGGEAARRASPFQSPRDSEIRGCPTQPDNRVPDNLSPNAAHRPVVKHLPKHLRPRWRYLAVGLESWPDAHLDRGAFQRECWYAAQNLLGDAGSAELDLEVYGFAFEDGAGDAVVKVRRGEVERARAVLACVDEVNGQPLGVDVRGVSGTVRACEEKYISRPRESGEERHVVFEDADRRAVGRGARIDVRAGEAFAGATELDFE